MLLSFTGDCTVARAEEIRVSLLDALNAGGSIEIDLGGVTGIDLTFCQILHALRLSCQARGVTLTLPDNLSKGLAHQAAFCGLPEIAGHPAHGGTQEAEGAR